jgi:hypothetical protein
VTRAHFVKRARKDNPVVKAGESYYWWKFAYGRKQYSAQAPGRSQLTQSEFYGTQYGIEDGYQDADIESGDDARTLCDDAVSQIEELRDEQEEKRENMPESLQDSPTGELLQERYDECDSWAQELEAACDTLESTFGDEDSESDDREAAVDDFKSISYEGG